MLLEWVLDKVIPRPGREAEFAALLQAEADPRRPAPSPRLAELGQTAYEAIGAPRVGVDPAATAWLRQQIAAHRARCAAQDVADSYRAYWSRPAADILDEHHGAPVIQLATDRGGIPTVQLAADPTLDFPAHVVVACPLLDPRLADEAFATHDARAALAYAARLQAGLDALVDRAPDAARRDVQAAVDWLRFWGERGFGFWAWC